jgi:hypothetical protein
VGSLDGLDRGDMEFIQNFNGEKSTWIIEEEVLRMGCGLNLPKLSLLVGSGIIRFKPLEFSVTVLVVSSQSTLSTILH